TLTWTKILNHRTQAVATAVAPFGLQFDTFLANSFLTSFVYNFPGEYAGIANKASVGNPFAIFGIWNGSQVQTMEFLQRFDAYDLIYRFPVYENEDYRLSGLVGPRFSWIWEGFKWRTVDVDVNGNSGPFTTAVYRQVTSNRMYGVSIGCSQECYLGRGFAMQMDTEAALNLDFVREKARYNLEQKFVGPISKRTKSEWTVAPELIGTLK